ncbi:MAG: MG2 domain-containing protein [Bacteroidota bacterium]
MKINALLFLLIIWIRPAVSQTLKPVYRWDKIEQSIKDKSRLTDVKAELGEIKTLAERNKNDVDLARAWYCEMLVKDLLTEDSLYFRNSAFIDSILLTATSRPALKTMMHLMQARRLDLFSRKSLKFNQASYQTKDLAFNYAERSEKTLDSLVLSHLQKAAAMGGKLPRVQGDLRWLSSNPDVLLFDADLEDIAIVEQIGNALLLGRGNRVTSVRGKNVMDYNQQQFLGNLPEIGRTLNWSKDVVSGYQAWLTKHRSGPEVHDYVASILRDAVYESFVEDSALYLSYEKHLLGRLLSAYPLVRAATTFQLFHIYVKNGQKYQRYFDPQYRQGYEKARQVYLKYHADVERYSFYGKQLRVLETQIMAKELSAGLNIKQIPGRPILLTVGYRNVSRLYYRIVKNTNLSGPLPKASALLKGSKDQLIVRTDSVDLPASGDYNNHSIYLKLEPLPVGNYHFIFAPGELASDSVRANVFSFSVTNLAAVNTNHQVILLDRQTGFPVKGAKITALVTIDPVDGQKKDTLQVIKQYTSDARGIFIPDFAGLKQLLIVKGRDTLLHNFEGTEQRLPDGIFVKDDYDDLDDYYDEQTKLQVYTDRGIYRPGQQVFFKTILVSKDPKTGQLVIFNKNKGKFFKKWMLENEPMLFLQDGKGRKMDSLRLVPDNYGGFSGTFVLPKNALPGDWRIEERFAESYAYSGEFKVEEYKRPTFELIPIHKSASTLPGAPFEFRLKARSFAGANLSGIKVAYTVARRLEYYGHNAELINAVGYTDHQGEVLISINDPLSAFTSNSNEKWPRVNYDLEATATDGTGEQAELKTSHQASAWQVDLQVQLKDFYRKSELPVLGISIETQNKAYAPDSISIAVYAVEKEKTAYGVKTDQWRYPLSELQKWFSAEDLGMDNERTKAKKLVFTERLSVKQALLRLNAANLTSGEYELRVETEQAGLTTGVFNRNFKVFDDDTVPNKTLDDIMIMPVNSHKIGDTAKVYCYFPDSTYLISSFSYFATRKKGIVVSEKLSSGIYKGGVLHTLQFVIPNNADELVAFTYAYIRNGKLFRNNLYFSIYKSPKQLPEIVIEKYRKVLPPGAKETFSLSIKTNNRHTAAQLLSTMYDARLDKLATHSFDLNKREGNTFRRQVRPKWSYGINDYKGAAVYEMNAPFYSNFVDGVLKGKVAGVFIEGFDSNKLDEVVVSYHDRRSYVVHGFNIRNTVQVKIKDASSLLGNKQDLIIIDGVPYAGNLADFDANLVTDGMVIKGQDAVALYGSRAASGVLVLSTKGKIVLPVQEPPLAKVRKNFNETAFFFPAVHADKQGVYSLNFTMPESVTTWNWKMMAHTLKGEFVYAERQLYTQLTLMVEANVPRLLYQGDELVLQSRISNLDSLAARGKVSCKIEDAVTGEDLTGIILRNAPALQDFASPASGNVYAAFRIKVPEGQLNPLKIVITAMGDRFADAEEHVIPVMTNSVFVRQSQPLRFMAADTVLQTTVLPDDAKLYGLGVSIQPKPQSALLNALPWLANYSYNCAEQIFNKFYANYMAYRLMQSDSALGLAYTKAAAALNGDSILKTEPVTEELMQTVTPWLGLQNKQWREQRQLFQLLDTVATKTVMEDYLSQLYVQQNLDGGMPWFKGGKSNKYISAYLLTGFGKLNGVLPSGSPVSRFKDFIQKLVAYSDHEGATGQDTYDVFARSFWLKDHPLSAGQVTGIRVMLADYWKSQVNKSLYSKTLAILSGMRVFGSSDPLYIQSKTQLESVLQMAIYDPVNGLRWKEMSDQEQPDVSAEELIELLSVAFRGLKQENELNEGLLKWILKTKSEHHWSTTKGTSAAINLLTKVKGSAVGVTAAFEAQINGKPLAVSDDLLSGKSTAFTKLDRRESSVSLAKTSGALAEGNLTWYYFSGAEHLADLNKAVKLHKQFYLLADDGSTWTAVTEQQTFKIGATIKTVLSITTAKPLRYVQLDDYRAAAFELVNKTSGQQSQNGLNFYQAVKDTGLQLFAEFIPAGKSEISYELRVVNEGVFTNGPAVLTCMYQPEIAAYSNALQLKVGH